MRQGVQSQRRLLVHGRGCRQGRPGGPGLGQGFPGRFGRGLDLAGRGGRPHRGGPLWGGPFGRAAPSATPAVLYEPGGGLGLLSSHGAYWWTCLCVDLGIGKVLMCWGDRYVEYSIRAPAGENLTR